MGKGKPTATPRELATAAGIMQGKSTAEAMRDAGYSATYANKFGTSVYTRLREIGLLPSDDDARDAIELLRKTVFSDKGVALVRMYETHLARAQAGSVDSAKLIMGYLVGSPGQAVTVQGPGGGPVETVTRVVFEWAEGNDADASDPDPAAD